MNATMQETETLLIAAKTLMDGIRRDRAERATVIAQGDGEDWFVAIFGTVDQRCASIDADIANALGRLGAIRSALLERGLTQDDCRALWQGIAARAKKEQA